MIGESFIITGLLLIAAGSLYRSKRKRWALATLPLTVLPAVNALASFVCRFIIGIEFNFVTAVCIIMGALVVSCTWMGFLTATQLSRRKTRVPYLVGAIAFNVVITAVFLGQYYLDLEMGK